MNSAGLNPGWEDVRSIQDVAGSTPHQKSGKENAIEGIVRDIGFEMIVFILELSKEHLILSSLSHWELMGFQHLVIPCTSSTSDIK